VTGTPMPRGRLCRSVRRSGDQLRHQELLALGRTSEAAWFLRDMEQLDPGARWFASGKLKEARKATDPTKVAQIRHESETLLADRPDDLSLVLELASLAAEECRFDEAADRIGSMLDRSRALRRRPPPALYRLLGHLRTAAGDDAGAQEAFDEFVRRSPDEQAARVAANASRAGALLSGGRVTEAAEAAERMTTVSDEPDVQLVVAMCRLRLGDLDAASRALELAERGGSKPRAVSMVRAQLLADRGQMEAETLARELVGSDLEADPGAFYTLAYVQATLHHPGAEETLRRYVAFKPLDPDLPSLLDRSAPGGGTWWERLGPPMPATDP